MRAVSCVQAILTTERDRNWTFVLFKQDTHPSQAWWSTPAIPAQVGSRGRKSWSSRPVLATLKVQTPPRLCEALYQNKIKKNEMRQEGVKGGGE